MRRYPITLPACALIMGVLLALAGAAAAFAQTPTPPTPAPTGSSTQAVPDQVTVVVQASNGTAGSALPANIAVRLYGIDGQAAAFTKDGVTDASGKVRFEGVPYQDGRAYGLTGEVGRTTYVTPLTTPKPGETEVNLPLRIYDTTTDASQVRIDKMYVVGEFVAKDKLQVINVYTLSNNSDRTVEGGQTTPDGGPATLRFDLPAGAAEVEFQGDDGKIYARTDGGFLYTRGLQPGPAALQVAVRYTLPYSGQLHLEPTVRYPVGALNVLLADQGVKLAAPQLKEQGTQSRQDGTQFRVYTAESLKAGGSIGFDLSGTPSLASPAPAAAPAAQTSAPAKKVTPAGLRAQAIALFAELRDEGGVGLLVSLFGMAVVLASALHWLLRRRAAHLALNPAARRRALAQLVVDLEEDYTAGKVEEEEYTQRRGRLKEALVHLA